MIRSRDQERAQYAYECIKKVKGKPFESKYRSYVIGAPTLILINGLGPAMAFMQSKKEDAYKFLVMDLDSWLKKTNTTSMNIIDWIMYRNTSSLDVYRATEEILALLNWMKRFANAELKEEV